MKRLTLCVVAAVMLSLGCRPAAAQLQPIQRPGPDSAEDGIQVTATGRVQALIAGGGFTLLSRGMTFRVATERPAAAPGRSDVRIGDRVRVLGELGAPDRIAADEVQILQRARGGGAASREIVGTIRRVDLEERRIALSTSAGPVRIEWDEETEFYRNSARAGARAFREGEQIRVQLRRGGVGENLARRIFMGAGPAAGWSPTAVGEIVGLDARNREMDVDFGGQVVTVRVRSATFRRSGRPVELDDLRLGQDVRIGGSARGDRSIDATQVEIVRGPDRLGDRDDRAPGRDDRGAGSEVRDLRTLDGRVVSVARDGLSLRMTLPGRTEPTEVAILDSTRITRGAGSRLEGTDLRPEMRLRVVAWQQGTRWVAQSIEVQPQ
jgi:hypothetical protein